MLLLVALILRRGRCSAAHRIQSGTRHCNTFTMLLPLQNVATPMPCKEMNPWLSPAWLVPRWSLEADAALLPNCFASDRARPDPERLAVLQVFIS